MFETLVLILFNLISLYGWIMVKDKLKVESMLCHSLKCYPALSSLVNSRKVCHGSRFSGEASNPGPAVDLQTYKPGHSADQNFASY
jgi:hypothetical protein